MEEHEPKISLPEALIAGTLLFGIPDAIELALIFVGLDTFWITDAFAFPGSQIYLRIKGVKSTYALAGNVLELVPYLGALPLRTIGFVMVVWLDHHPKAEALIGAAAKSGALPKAGAKEAAPTPKATPGAAAGGSRSSGRNADPESRTGAGRRNLRPSRRADGETPGGTLRNTPPAGRGTGHLGRGEQHG